MDVTVTIPDQHLQLVADTAADRGFEDPGGTVAQRKTALTAFLATVMRKELTEWVKAHQRREAVKTVDEAPSDPLA